MGIPSGWELVILLAVLVVLFGATKLPTAARSIGQSIRIFKAETRGARSEDQDQASSPASEQQSLPPAGSAPTGSHQPQRHDDTIR
ncbi:MAG: Sec-independent protein translocase subunit TatA [Pseudonocardiales bacterium]|nr:Sec-independent protein translocase subunit TatA [Pseudonocardiales bacterium]